MRWFRSRESPDVLEVLEHDAHAAEVLIQNEERVLRTLFSELKTALIDEFLAPNHGPLRAKAVRVLREQVRHVLSVARTIGESALVESFTQEDVELGQIEQLLEEYPGTTVEGSPDLCACLERLKDLMRAQQEFLFSHEKVLLDEKRRVVTILQQVEELRKDRDQVQHLPQPKKPPARVEFS